jgi:lipid II:glycine glycyltransferase (peptidoglycan interpeptide bridge formation enzyme)
MIESTLQHESELLPNEWNAFVASQSTAHLLQSWAWGDFKAQFGWEPVRLAVQADDELAGVAQILLRASPLGKLAYIPKGPVFGTDDPGITMQLWQGIHETLQTHGVFALKVEPEWPDEERAHKRLQEAGFVHSDQTVQPRQTIVVDLSPDKDEILAAMKSKTRYNIRLASRKGVKSREGDAQDVEIFYDMMETTGERNEFGIHSRDYYRQAWRQFSAQDRAKLFLATYEGQPLAGIMVFAFGKKSWYMYGSSSNKHRNLMPTYLVQWEAISWAKAKGCQHYDLCGIPDMDEDVLEAAVRDRDVLEGDIPELWGVYRFKRGFGGQVIRYVGAYDYIYKPLRHRLFNWAMALREKTRE